MSRLSFSFPESGGNVEDKRFLICIFFGSASSVMTHRYELIKKSRMETKIRIVQEWIPAPRSGRGQVSRELQNN